MGSLPPPHYPIAYESEYVCGIGSWGAAVVDSNSVQKNRLFVLTPILFADQSRLQRNSYYNLVRGVTSLRRLRFFIKEMGGKGPDYSSFQNILPTMKGRVDKNPKFSTPFSSASTIGGKI